MKEKDRIDSELSIIAFVHAALAEKAQARFVVSLPGRYVVTL